MTAPGGMRRWATGVVAVVLAAGLLPAGAAAQGQPPSGPQLQAVEGRASGDASPAQDDAPSGASGWEPEEPRYDVETERDVAFVMDDGRVLRGDVHHPVEPDTGERADGPFPVILTLTPYGKSVTTLVVDPTPFVERGYLGVVVDVAGTGGSDGVSQLFGPVEADDSRQLIDHVAALPTSSGTVGMTGLSYLGIVQLFAAAEVGPGSPLRAIFPVAASADPYRDLFVSGGMVNVESSLGLLAAYAGLRTLTPLLERSGDPLDALRLSLEHGVQTLAFEGRILLDVLLDGDRGYDTAWWQHRAPERVLEDIVANGVAVHLVGGLYDVFQRGTPLLYSGLQNATVGRDVRAPMLPDQPVSSEIQLWFGPWDHGDQGAGLDLTARQLRWFDHFLKDRDTGITDTDTPLRVIEPDRTSYDAATYPPTGVGFERLHLAAGGRLATDDPPADAGTDTLLATGLSDVCTRSTQQFAAGAIPPEICGEQRHGLTALPGDLVYTSDPVEEPLRLAGPATLTVQARTDRTDVPLVARLFDVAADGTARQLSGGALLGSMRALDEDGTWFDHDGEVVMPRHLLTEEARKPVTPGELTRYDVEIRPVFTILQPGHRLQLVLASADIPHLLPASPRVLDWVGGITHVHRDAAAPSWLSLPVLPADAAGSVEAGQAEIPR